MTTAIARIAAVFLLIGVAEARAGGQTPEPNLQVRELLVSAGDTAMSVKGRPVRDALVTEVALRLITSGSLDDAAAVSSTIADRSRRAAVLGAIVRRQLDGLDLERAIATMQRFLPESRERHWYKISLQLDYGRSGLARPDRIGIRRALEYAEAGDFTSARDAAERITDRMSRYEAFYGIVLAQARVGDIDGALGTAERIPARLLPRAPANRPVRADSATEYRAHALRAVAVAQADARDFDAALKTIDRIAVARIRESAMWNLIEKQAAGGDLADALKLAERVGDALDRLSLAGHAASCRFALGDEPGAESTLSDALKAVPTMEPPSSRLKAAIETGRSRFADLSLLKAVAWARRLTSPFEKSAALIGIVDGLFAR